MKNLLKEKLRKGKRTFGTFLTIGHAYVAEVIGSVGLDFVVIDTEHSPLSVETAQLLMQAMSYSQTTPLIRVAWNDPVMVKRALDIGAHGIIFPWINNKDEAERAVKAVRYPPEGIRGFGPRRPLIRDKDYMKDANREVLVAAQIETKQALDRLDEIFSVDGIDVAMVGPADLSLSLGVFPNKKAREFRNAIKRIVKACEKHGLAASIYSEEGEVESWIEDGFKMIIVEADASMLSKGARRISEIARAHV